VVLTHCAVYTDNLGHDLPELLYLRAGHLALCVFFGLSGFLLYRPFLAAQFEGRPRQTFGAYARRRVLRVVPAYWLALTVLSIVPGVPGMFDAGWWKQYLFLHTYTPRDLSNGLPQTWSLGIEVGIYFLLPMMVLVVGWVTSRARPAAAPAWALGIIGIFCLIGIGLTGWGLYGHHFLLWHTGLSYLWWFCAGMALAVLSVRPPRRLTRLIERARANPGACWAVALVAFAFDVWLGPLGPVGDFAQQWFLMYVLTPLAALPLLAPAVFVARGGRPRRVLASPPLMWLGLVSYGIFLWHIGVLFAFQDLGVTKALTPDGLFPLFVLVLAVSVGCAAVSYYWVERPFYALKDRRIRRPRARGKERPARARA
jgi:peptidoglycan/LPS O-acetylase OafA/YrhL